jgi:hypothetical protein
LKFKFYHWQQILSAVIVRWQAYFINFSENIC